MSGPPAFELHGAVKRYGQVTALAGVTLASPVGEIYGLLGPNGAGKTTIVKILTTLIAMDGGSASVMGIDVARQPGKVREVIGLAGQNAALDEFQTGYENVFMVGELYGLPRAEVRRRTEELIERLDLSEAARRPISTYSGGMRRRLDLGASLIGRPQVLFLDEPTTGLDPKSRNDVWGLIRELVADGTSILLTTQYLEEADELADHIAVVDRGALIADGTSDELKSTLGGDVIEFRLDSADDRVAALAAVAPQALAAPGFDTDTATVTVPVRTGSDALMAVVQALNDDGIRVRDLSLHRPSLDDVFLALTGQSGAAPATAPAPERSRP